MSSTPNQPDDKPGAATMVSPSASSSNWREDLGLFFVYVLLFAALSFSAPYFFTVRNMLNILVAVSTIGVVAVAMTMVIVSGGIDLSVGSIAAITGVVIALASRHMPMPLAVSTALAIGMLIGAFNGVAITWGRINPLITTLGTMSIVRGLAFVFSSGSTQSITNQGFQQLARGFLFGVPRPAIAMSVLFIIAAWVMRATVFGRNIYAIGGNAQASRLAGLPVTPLRISVYMLSGLSAAVGGIIVASQLGAAAPQASAGLELSAIAAVILGGTSLAGGKGSIWGTLLGVLIMGTLNNGLDKLSVSSYYQDVARGTVLLLAVGLDQLRQSWNAR